MLAPCVTCVFFNATISRDTALPIRVGEISVYPIRYYEWPPTVLNVLNYNKLEFVFPIA